MRESLDRDCPQELPVPGPTVHRPEVMPPLDALVQASDEGQVVERTMGLYGALFAPKRITFLSMCNGTQSGIVSRPPQDPEDDAAMLLAHAVRGDGPYVATDDSLLFRVAYLDETLGIVALRGIDPHRQPQSLLAFGSTVSGICGLALAQARKAERLRQAEDRLRQNQEFQDFAFATAFLGAWELDLIDHTAQRSLEHDRVFGYEELLPEWTYEMFLNHVLPEDRQEVDRKFREAIEGKRDWDFECRITRRDGEVRWIWAAGRHAADGSGTIRSMKGVVQDITERRRAQKQLARRAAELEAVLDSLQDAVFVYDATGKVIRANPAAQRFYVVDIAGPLGVEGGAAALRIRKVDGAEMSPQEFPSRRALRGERVVREQYLFLGRDGTDRVGEVSATPLFLEGALAGAVAITRDVTERRRAEEALRRSETRYRSFVELTNNWAWVTTSGGEAIEDIPALREFTGQTYEQFRGTGWVTTLHPEDTQRVLEVWGHAIKSHGFYETKYRMRRRDGVFRVILARGVPIMENGEVIEWVGSCLDVTEQERTDQELRELNHTLDRRVAERTTQLESANKELEAFSYSVSHDLRAPLRAVDGYARMLAEDFSEKLDSEGHRLIGVICAEARRMGTLIDDLLTFSRTTRRELQVTAIDMTALTRAVFDECAARAPHRRLQLHLSPLAPAHGDAAMLRQVVQNIIDNAIKYTCGRSLGVIDIRSCPAGEGFTDARADENVYLIRDNGVGFDMKYVGKLFGVFQRLHSEADFEGTGVGLALVQRIIHRHGGRVRIEGRIDEGTTLYFTLPARKVSPR